MTSKVQRWATIPDYDGVAIWPDGLALPDLDTTEVVRELLFAAYVLPRDMHGVIDAAEQDGVVADLDTALASPERAFLELETARIRAEHLYYHERNDWASSHLEPGETFRDNFAAIWLQAPGRPVQDFTEMLALSDAVQRAFPDHKVADYAQMYRTIGLFPKGMRAGRDDYDARVFFSALREIDDPVLAEQAAIKVIGLDPWIAVPPSGLDVLAGIDTTAPITDAAISDWALNAAFALGDWDRATTWLARFRKAMDSYCADDDLGDECTGKRASLIDATGRLDALDRVSAQSWEEALVAAVWRCHLDGDGQRGTSTGEASWKDGLQWDEWEDPTAVTQCLEATGVEAPHPPDGARVQLTLQGPPAAE